MYQKNLFERLKGALMIPYIPYIPIIYTIVDLKMNTNLNLYTTKSAYKYRVVAICCQLGAPMYNLSCIYHKF